MLMVLGNFELVIAGNWRCQQASPFLPLEDLYDRMTVVARVKTIAGSACQITQAGWEKISSRTASTQRLIVLVGKNLIAEKDDHPTPFPQIFNQLAGFSLGKLRYVAEHNAIELVKIHVNEFTIRNNDRMQWGKTG